MAALNILKKATQGHWGSWSKDLNAWGDLSSILVGSNICQDKTGQTGDRSIGLRNDN